MGNYTEKHSSSHLPFKPTTYITEIKDNRTGEKAKGEGFTRDDANKIAFKTLKEANESDSNYTPTPDSEEESKGCYLTTACIESIGLSDNCLELKVLRNFRDKVLLQTSNGRKAVKEYYHLAPKIISSIKEHEKDGEQKIWSSTYKDIRKVVSLVLSKNFNEAFKHYSEITLKFKEKYLN